MEIRSLERRRPGPPGAGIPPSTREQRGLSLLRTWCGVTPWGALAAGSPAPVTMVPDLVPRGSLGQMAGTLGGLASSVPWLRRVTLYVQHGPGCAERQQVAGPPRATQGAAAHASTGPSVTLR